MRITTRTALALGAAMLYLIGVITLTCWVLGAGDSATPGALGRLLTALGGICVLAVGTGWLWRRADQ